MFFTPQRKSTPQSILQLHAVPHIPGGPEITEQSIQSIFRNLLIIKLFSSPCWKEHLFPIIITPRSSNLVENFLFYETFFMDCHYRDLPDFQSFEARWQINGKSQKYGQSPKWSSAKRVFAKRVVKITVKTLMLIDLWPWPRVLTWRHALLL